MITAALKNKIVATLGAHYSKKIIPYLIKKEVYNAKGEPYSSQSIRNIVCGRENEAIETHILNLVSETLSAKKRLKVKKSKILKKK